MLATNEHKSFAIFQYAHGRIQWTTGDASGGNNGLGGTEAVAGINFGNAHDFPPFTLPGSLTPEILRIDETSNVGIPGVWIFQIGESK